MKTGTANIPLHYGKTPRWLFLRMAELAKNIAIVIVDEFGSWAKDCEGTEPFSRAHLRCTFKQA
jgi:hypothetical protein